MLMTRECEWRKGKERELTDGRIDPDTKDRELSLKGELILEREMSFERELSFEREPSLQGEQSHANGERSLELRLHPRWRRLRQRWRLPLKMMA
jgi:hypothetical protein